MLSGLCRRKWPHLTLTGESPGFSRVAAGGLGFLSKYHEELREPLVFNSGKLNLHSSCEGECGSALESQQGNQASIHVEGGISRSFSSCGRKLWVPSSCDGDLRELLMVPMGSQESFRVVRGLLGFLWGQCNGRGSHLQLRQEPQVSSPVLTWISGCVCSFKQGVRSQLMLGHGTLLSSRAVKEVSGLQSS